MSRGKITGVRSSSKGPIIISLPNHVVICPESISRMMIFRCSRFDILLYVSVQAYGKFFNLTAYQNGGSSPKPPSRIMSPPVSTQSFQPGPSNSFIHRIPSSTLFTCLQLHKPSPSAIILKFTTYHGLSHFPSAAMPPIANTQRNRSACSQARSSSSGICSSSALRFRTSRPMMRKVKLVSRRQR
jgi:hypothetical protein